MADDPQFDPETADALPLPTRRRWPRWLGWAALVLLAVLAATWLSRERIADSFIADQVEKLGLPATYKVESIGTDRQVLTDVVIGDPARPDLTIERVEVATTSAWGLPGLGRITLVRPRAWGSYRAGKLSFGSLDPLIFTDSAEPAVLPDLDLALVDARVRLDTDFGPVGVKAEGAGRLPDGFAGTLAALAPHAAAADCTGEGVSFYGKVTTASGKARFAGPVRLASLACPQRGLKLAASGVETDFTLDPHFDGAEGTASLRAGALAAGSAQVEGSDGTARFVWRKNALTAHYDLAARRVQTPQAALAALGVIGVVRSGGPDSRLDVEGEVSGSGMRPGQALDAMLAGVMTAGQGTLAEPVIRQIRAGLAREAPGSALAGQFVLRRTAGLTSLVVPQARLTGGSGQALLALSRLSLIDNGQGSPRISGNFQTGGSGMPRIAGRMERVAGGRLVSRMTMAEYSAGSARIAVPELMAVQAPGGALGFVGKARLTGDLPGGRAEALELPIDGNWSAAGGLALWRQCTPVRFASLSLASLRLERRGLTLCPPGGSAIVRNGPGGLRIAAGAPSLELAGRLGDTPLRVRSGPFGLAWPGTMAARMLDVELGPVGTASHFRIANLAARLGGEVAGNFTGSDIRLAAVPLDLLGAEGNWRYAGGKLAITGGTFRLADREPLARFQPLLARDAVLDLTNNVITANALLREPQSDREIVRADIVHNLANGHGDARLGVDGITFDNQLQPDTLSRLTLGVIANATGTVRGTGRIDWSPAAVTSTGSFSTDGFDFAAAFGPVKGVAGTVQFTDLLGLITAPDQRLKIASINPGIEATDGELSFEMRDGDLLVVNGAHWPFLEGTLELEPTRMVLGASEVRRYTMIIRGLDAARFLERLELANLSASGVFDGRIPLVFDENGGRVQDGILVSRPPGGNVSYVGQLSYQDLSPMANFAFDALKSIDYKHMQIDMNGALEGEIVTRVAFDGLGQGKSARQNFLTRRIAKLPIRFAVNLKAPFFRLVSSFKALYDPAFITDPRLLGLVGADGKPLGKPSGVQPPVSESTP